MHQSFESDPQNDRTTPASSAMIVDALEAFAHAETLNDTLRVLEEQQAILLLPDTLTTIQMMIDDMFANNQDGDARNWRQYLHLLKDALQRGINTAWSYFITQQSNAAQALEAVTTASTMEHLYQIVIEKQHSLLTDAALVMLDNNIQRQYSLAPPQIIEYWQQLLHLLEDAQMRGIVIAWLTFKYQQPGDDADHQQSV
ncbi:MAG: hypothetical protein ABI406_00215 [Ktedonobacteraceae bacterium]